jgi:DNA topoisomerase I
MKTNSVILSQSAREDFAAIMRFLAGFAMDNAEFKEADHPREDDGKFGAGGGAKAATKSDKSASAKPAAKSGHEQTVVVDGQRRTASGGPLPAHVQALKIPPAWTAVTYAADPKADLLATGKDEKGRAQSIYSEAHEARQAAAKFARIRELQAKFGEVASQNEEARKAKDAKKRDSADALALIMATGIRPGSDEDTGAAVKAYGATTLEGKHVMPNEDGTVSLKFIGKKGVSLDIHVSDPAIAQMLKERAGKAGADGKLFGATNQGALLEHTHTLDGGGFKSKDFRTLKGTQTAMAEVAKAPQPNPPKTEAEYRKAVMAVAKKVSAVLGNTPTVALQSYIDPSVFTAWRSSHA